MDDEPLVPTAESKGVQKTDSQNEMDRLLLFLVMAFETKEQKEQGKWTRKTVVGNAGNLNG